MPHINDQQKSNPRKGNNKREPVKIVEIIEGHGKNINIRNR